MRLVLTIAGMIVSTAAVAIEVPLTAAYGTAAGCALATRSGGSPPGDAHAFTAAEVIYRRMTCPYTGVTARSTDAAAPSWEVNVRCANEHEGDIPGAFLVTERPADHLLIVQLLSGEGPAGEFEACAAGQAPAPAP